MKTYGSCQRCHCMVELVNEDPVPYCDRCSKFRAAESDKDCKDAVVLVNSFLKWLEQNSLCIVRYNEHHDFDFPNDGDILAELWTSSNITSVKSMMQSLKKE